MVIICFYLLQIINMAFIDFEDLESIRESYLDFSYTELCQERKRFLAEDKHDQLRLDILNDLIKDAVTEGFFGREE